MDNTMSEKDISPANCSAGDYCWTEKKISVDDYEKFNALSLDYSPIHSDSDYAAKTEFGKRVAPLFLTSAPFSGLVGCGIPGDQALLMRASIVAEAPIFYGDEIRYSLRVISNDRHTRVVSLKALGIRGSEIVLSGEILAKIRPEVAAMKADTIPRPSLVRRSDKNVLVLIGGTSKIGQSIAHRAVKSGYEPVIVYHSNEQKAFTLKRELENLGRNVEVLSCQQFIKELENSERAGAWRSRVSGLVTLHSAPIDDPYEDLYRTNVRENIEFINALLPDLLLCQDATVINIGTGMMVRGGSEYPGYLHAKLALHHYFEQESIRLGKAGLRWVTVAPDQVDTSFSRDIDGAVKLLPEEVADEVLRVLDDRVSSGETFSWIRHSGVRRGRFGGFQSSLPIKTGVADVETRGQEAPPEIQSGGSYKLADETQVSTIVREIIEGVLKIDLVSHAGDEIGVGQIAGWDSARHLEIIMNVEKEFGLTLQTSDYAEVETIHDITDLIAKRR